MTQTLDSARTMSLGIAGSTDRTRSVLVSGDDPVSQGGYTLAGATRPGIDEYIIKRLSPATLATALECSPPAAG